MYRKMLFLINTLLLTAGVFAAEDEQIVREILDECGLDSLTVKDVAVIENGSVITLNLSNRDIRKDGVLKIPQKIGELTELREFICTGNSITEIPTEIGELVNLEVLNLGSNRIVAVPSEIGDCKKLKKLDLRHNSLTLLPNEIGNLENLEYLWLWGNKLTSLNNEITRLHRLKELYLKDNRLTTLPVGIIRMKFDYIDLIGNKLCDLSSVLDHWAKKIDDKYLSTQRCW